VPHRLDAPACSHYIIVDCVTKGRKDLSALGTLKNNFVAQLAKKLPCIAVQTLSPLQWSRLEQVVDFACRGLPLLMLDTRPIPSGGYPRTLDAGEEYVCASKAGGTTANAGLTWERRQERGLPSFKSPPPPARRELLAFDARKPIPGTFVPVPPPKSPPPSPPPPPPTPQFSLA
jgi:hypothetical protein